MKFKGVIFDFNGTLFWDTEYHDKAWDIFLKKYGFELTHEEKDNLVHGKNNVDIIASIFKNNLPLDARQKLSYEKEKIYRDICLEKGMILAPGSIDFLDKLKHHNISMTIATASPKINIDFFINQFQLYKWFDLGAIVCDDGTIKSKPDPEIFFKAAENINTPPEKCIVVEDSFAGVKSAQNAYIGKIFLINSGRIKTVEDTEPIIDFYDLCNKFDTLFL